MKKLLFLSLTLAGLLMATDGAWAQGGRRIIQFSGIITTKDNEAPVVGAYVYVPKAGRGTSTNAYGFFSFPTLTGDTVMISSVGFQRKYYIIPQTEEPALSVVIELLEEVTLLPAVQVLPYPTEKEFKEAFIALELPDEQLQQNMERNLDPDELNRVVAEMGMGASGNYRYTMNQQVNAIANRNFVTTVPLLNPFAWAEFIKSVKRGDLKRQDRRK